MTKGRITKALKCTAYHEAGHAVVAHYARIRTKKLTITPGEGHLGYHEKHPSFGGILSHIDPVTHGYLGVELPPRVQRRLENLALVSFAGAAAERRFNPRGRWRQGAENDYHWAMELLSRREPDNEALGKYCDIIVLRARNAVGHPLVWPVIEHLAARLLECRTMTGPQVLEAIREGEALLVDRIERAGKARLGL